MQTYCTECGKVYNVPGVDLHHPCPECGKYNEYTTWDWLLDVGLIPGLVTP